jgi:two-component system sensor kinase FixL
MNKQCRRHRSTPERTESIYGGLVRVPSRSDQGHISGLQLHHSNPSPVPKDRVIVWPAYRSSADTAPLEISSPAKRSSALVEASSMQSLTWESAVMVHELRQPLSAIVSNAEANLRWLKLETPNLDEAVESAKKIIRDARAAADLMQKLGDVFRGSGPQQAKVDINALICEVLCRLADRIDERGIAAKTSMAGEAIFVHADATQLEQVLQNLISNAIDAMEGTSPCDRMLVIHSRRETDGTVLVAVEDKGCGIDNVERIFDPFFSTKNNGLGLGLWICSSIIQSHNGKLWAEKVWHGGTKFSFTVPVY